MVTWKEIYQKGADEKDILGAKALMKRKRASWETCYYGAKILYEADEESPDLEMIAGLMSRAIRAGLSYQKSREQYLDAMKVLSTLYTKEGKYDRVLNYLLTILEIDENAPDWVHHQFVFAQIHTAQIRRILKSPKWFLSDLARADQQTDEIRNRQQSIFKQFLVEALIYMKANPQTPVKTDDFRIAAKAYELDKSEGWQTFLKLAEGKTVKIPIPAPGPAASTGTARDLFNQLFTPQEPPKPQVDPELEKKYKEFLDQMARLQQEQEEKRKALEAKAEADKQQKEQLEAELEKLQKEKEEAAKKSAVDPVLNVVSHVNGFLFTAQNALTDWLSKYLPSCSYGDWWQDCVIDKLSYVQLQAVYDKNITTLNGLDLSSLLQITKKNWYRLGKYVFVEDNDFEVVKSMFDVRNDWAHISTELPPKADIIADLYTISDFMVILNCANATVTEVDDFIAAVGDMSIA